MGKHGAYDNTCDIIDIPSPLSLRPLAGTLFGNDDERMNEVATGSQCDFIHQGGGPPYQDAWFEIL